MPVTNTGLSILCSPKEADLLADIVFVHGIQGHPRKTWTAHSSNKGPTSKSKQWITKTLKRLTLEASQQQSTADGNSGNLQADIFWPLDLLPEDCPDCRILTFGYDSMVSKFFAGPANQNSIIGHSKDLLYALGRKRDDCQGRYIIFVAHSFGGILVKEVLRRAANDNDASVLDVGNATKVVFFLGTPHRGSNLAPWAEIIRNIVAASGFDTNSKNIRALRFDSPELEYAQDDFMQLWQQEKFIVRTFQEGLPYGGFNEVVPDISSSLGDRREHAEHINANHCKMCRFASRDDPGYQQVGGELRRVTKKLRLDLQKSQSKTLEPQSVKNDEHIGKLSSEELECLRSLCVPEVDTWEYDVGQDMHTTCTWLFGMQEYHSWKDVSNLQMKNTLLRVKGKLGAGKSTSLKVAMSKLWDEKSSLPGVKLAFFFNGHGNALEKSQLGLFQSLLFQLFRQSKRVFRRFMPIFRLKAYGRRWTWDEKELKKFFMSVMTDSQLPSAFIFIDALHECEEARDIITFFEDLRTSALHNEIPVKICYSSRHYPPIKVGDCLELRIDAHNNDDIKNYIEKMLEPLFKRQHIDQLKSYIVEKAQGVFLWVVLVVAKIVKANDNGVSMEKMQEIMETVPDKLESLYREALKSTSTDCPSETLLILQWMLCATRPITLLELRYALAFRTGQYKSQAEAEDSLSFIESDQQMDLFHRAHTGGLTETKTQKAVKTKYARQILDTDCQTTIHLVHDSVRSFLLKHGGLQLLDSGSTDEILRQGQQKLAEACINYLDSAELRHIAKSNPEPKSSVQRNQLSSSSKFAASILFSCPSSLLYNRMEEIFFVWRYLFDLDCRCRFWEVHGTRTTLAHLAAEYGLADWVKYYLSNGGDVNLRGGRLGALLQAAAGRLGSALSAAASEGHLTIVKTLIQRGSRVNDECGQYGCALQAAVCSLKETRNLVHVLLDTGADMHMQTGKFGTVLQAAACNGDEEMVRTLLAHGADINIKCGKYGTAIAAAAAQGYEKIVQIFLEHGADPTVKAGDYGDSIWAAAYKGQGHVLRQILRHQWPLWQQDEVESKAQDILSQAARTVTFHQAAGDGDLDVVEKSIEDGVDLNARGGAHSSALHVAITYGHTEVVALLLAQENIKVDMSDVDGRTPVWIAASTGLFEIAKMLLEAGKIDIRRESGSGRNLLWYAAYDGRMDMVRLMWEAGADPFEPDSAGITPFMAAEKGDRQEVISFFQKAMGRKE